MSQYLEFVANHPMLFAFLGAVIALIVATELRRFTRGYKAISPTDAVLMMNHGDTLLLDVREDGEVRAGMINGSKHIPLGSLAQRVKELEPYKAKNVIAYCRSGNRSATACSVLRKHEFANVYNLTGGIVAWEGANLPVKKR